MKGKNAVFLHSTLDGVDTILHLPILFAKLVLSLEDQPALERLFSQDSIVSLSFIVSPY